MVDGSAENEVMIKLLGKTCEFMMGLSIERCFSSIFQAFNVIVNDSNISVGRCMICVEHFVK